MTDFLAAGITTGVPPNTLAPMPAPLSAGFAKPNAGAAGLAASSALGRPKLKGVDAGAGGGAAAGAAALPKKLGTPFAAGGADGLPIPSDPVFFAASVRMSLAILVKSGGGLVGVEDEEPRAKNPDASGFATGGAGAPVSGGDSGSATIEPPASGDEALGRLELNRESGPGRPDGTVRLDAAGCAPELDDCAGAAEVDAAGAGLGVRPAKLIPEKLGS